LTAFVGTLVSLLTTSDSVFCASVYILVKIVIAAVKGVQLAKLISSQDFLPFTAFSGSFASNEKETIFRLKNIPEGYSSLPKYLDIENLSYRDEVLGYISGNQLEIDCILL